MAKCGAILMLVLTIHKYNCLEIGKECQKTRSSLDGEQLTCKNVSAYFFRKFDLALNRTHWLNCENCTLGTIDDNTFMFQRNNISFLFLTNSQVRTLKKLAFATFPLLKVLSLRNNNIESIDPRAFSSNKKLLQLDLSKNYLKILTNNLFSELANLDVLNLNNNEIFYIQPEAFSGLSVLKYLYLNNNDLKKLEDKSFRHLTNLKILYVENNNISEMHPLAFTNMTNLNYLYLNNNSISYLVQYNFKALASLTDLQLRSNQLVEIQTSAFNGLTNLRYLYLGDNNISLVKRYGFIGLDNLQILDLAKNSFDIFDLGYIENLSSLRMLWLAENDIYNITIEPEANTLALLQVLDLTGNNLSEINYHLLSMKVPNLYEVFVANNSWQCDFFVEMVNFYETQNVSFCITDNCSQNATSDFIEDICVNNNDYSDRTTDFATEDASSTSNIFGLTALSVVITFLGS